MEPDFLSSQGAQMSAPENGVQPQKMPYSSGHIPEKGSLENKEISSVAVQPRSRSATMSRERPKIAPKPSHLSVVSINSGVPHTQEKGSLENKKISSVAVQPRSRSATMSRERPKIAPKPSHLSTVSINSGVPHTQEKRSLENKEISSVAVQPRGRSATISSMSREKPKIAPKPSHLSAVSINSGVPLTQVSSVGEQSATRNKHQATQIALQRCKASNKKLFNDNQRLKEQNQGLRRAYQQLERKSLRDELVPFNISQLPNLGEHQGSGSYGSVYRIQLNGVNCIAKKLHDILLGQGREVEVSIEDKSAAYQKFEHECILLSRMRHPNIVQFMGVHFGPERDYGRELTLVMERLYMNLEECLKKYQNIDTWLKVTILLDVSQGLLHLHSQGIVHRDLTAPNILLTTSFHAKIADLGVSKILSVHPLHATKQTMVPGTLGYMPPEVQAEVPQYGYPLDIFSFGVLMLFVIIQEYPQFYENAMTHTGFQQREVQIQKRIKWIRRLSPEDPMRQLICRCLQDDPQRRPTAIELNSKVTEFSTQHPKPYKDILDMQKRMQARHPHDNWRSSQYPAQFPMASTLPRIHNFSRGRNHQ